MDIKQRKKIADDLTKIDLKVYEEFEELLNYNLTQLKKKKIKKEEYLSLTNPYFERIKEILGYLDLFLKSPTYHYKSVDKKEILLLILEAMIDKQLFDNSNIDKSNYKRDIKAIEKNFYKIKTNYENDIKQVEEKLGYKLSFNQVLNIPKHPNDIYKTLLTKLEWKGLKKQASITLSNEALEMEKVKITKAMRQYQLDFLDVLFRMIDKGIEDKKTTLKEQSNRINTLNKVKKKIKKNEIFVVKGKITP